MTQFNMINEPTGPDPKRLFLAVAVSSVVLMAYSYFFPPAQPSPPAPTVALEQKIDAPKPELKLGDNTGDNNYLSHPLATPADLKLANMSFAKLEDKPALARVSYEGQISSLGGFISSYALTGFSKDRKLFDYAKNGSFFGALSSTNSLVSLNKDAPYELISQDESQLVLRHVTKEGLSVERRYEFLQDARLSEQISLKNLSNTPLKLELLLSSHKIDEKGASPGLLNPGVQGQSIVVKTAEKHERFSGDDLLDKAKIINNIKYAAFDDQFFLSAIMPDKAEYIDRAEILVHDIKDQDLRRAQIDFYLKPFVLVLGEERLIENQLFLGPKQVDLLASISPPLDENIDFGWFGALSRPMLWLLVQIFNVLGNYGLAIILITFIIKLLTYPLTHKSFKSQQEMKLLAPKIQELKNKFGHDRTLLGQKQMELYKQHGVNPVAGCLPMLIQFPVWFAVFQMLRNSVELFDQPFYGWIHDLTLPDTYVVLPIVMGLSMLAQQVLTPTPTPADQPHMKYVMWSMPIFLTFIMLNMPSGLSLYMITNNLLTILQQIIIKKQSAKLS